MPYFLQGIEGIAITYDEDYNPKEADEEILIQGPRFSIDSTISEPYPTLQFCSFFDLCIDPSLRDLTARILPLATYYKSILYFTELRSAQEYGLVNHALCAALRDRLKVNSFRVGVRF